MTTSTTRLFDSWDDAAAAVRDLKAAGVPDNDIGMVANNSEDWYTEKDPNRVAEDAGAGAAVGGALGGGAGLLAGIGLLAIPGVGPVVAAGWLVATAAGAAAGALVGGATGGLVGALVNSGVDKNDAHVYAEGVRRGGTLVSVQTSDANAARIEQILDNHTGVTASARGSAYRASGWSTFDESAPAYSADQVRRERELYRR